MINRFGSLIIPPASTVHTLEDSEFGTLRTVKKPTYLYSTIPDEAITSVDKKSLRKIRLDKKKPFPAILTDKSGNESAGVHNELQPGQELLARAVPGYPDVLEVVLFEKAGEVVEDMTETGDGINITSKGYVLAKDVKHKSKPAHFKTVHQPIFQNKNLIDDIKQNTFGDCFLLASVLAILSKEGGSDYIRSMMVQDGDYTVVRLYDPNSMPAQPLYVRVKNSVYYENGNSVVKHQALWVHVLEKAYTAAGFKKEKDQFVISFPAFREMYGNGGGPATAMTILTGQSASRNIVLAEQGYPWKAVDWMLSMTVYNHVKPLIDKFSVDDTRLLDQLDGFLSSHKDAAYLGGLVRGLYSNYEKPLAVRIKAFQQALGKDAKVFDDLLAELQVGSEADNTQVFNALVTYIDRYNEIWVQSDELVSELYSSVRQMAEAGEFVFKLFTTDKLSEFLQLEKPVGSYEDAMAYLESISHFRPAPPVELQRLLQNFVNNSDAPRWSLPVGAAIYASGAEEVFANLKSACQQQNQIVAVSTKAKFPGNKFPGLRPQHAYAVTGVCEEKDKNGAIHKFVKVRNPWGHTGMHYQTDKKGNVAVTEVVDRPEFKVELVHFIDYFGAYSAGSFVSAPKLSADESKSLHERHAATAAHLSGENSFFGRHWKKMIVGALIGTALVVAGIFTFGMAPLALIAVPALIATIAFFAPIVGAAIGAAFGAGTGAVADCASPDVGNEQIVQRQKQSFNQADVFKGINASPSRSGSSSEASTSSSEESSGEEPRPHPNFVTRYASGVSPSHTMQNRAYR